MNIAFIIYIIGWILSIEAVSLLLPALVGLIYNEQTGIYYLVTGVICLIIGIILTRKKPKNQKLFAREGFALVALCWIVMSLVGALPLFFSGEIPMFTNALFEIVSGFTTTGASILDDVEAMSHAGLFWRSFSHWIGGMGVFVFLLCIMPMTGGNNIHLMKAESPGPSVGKLVPKLRDTAKILYIIYFVLTVVLFIALLIAKMPLFDAIVTSIGTAGTGGFGIKGDSIGGYNDAVQWIVAVGMMMFGINFNFYFFLLGKNKKEAFKIEEVRWYVFAVIAATVIIAFNISGMCGSLYEAFKYAFFQVNTLITSTGFATTNFDLWPSFSKIVLVSLMFMGACAGSTGGGIKVSRYVIMFKAIKQEIDSFIHPRSVKSIEMDGKVVDKAMVKSVFMFLGAYAIIFTVSAILLSLDSDKSIVTSFTAVVACLSNMGPGLDQVGPAANFNGMTIFSKYVLIFDMLAGRLELFPMIVLFSPSLWRRNK